MKTNKNYAIKISQCIKSLRFLLLCFILSFSITSIYAQTTYAVKDKDTPNAQNITIEEGTTTPYAINIFGDFSASDTVITLSLTLSQSTLANDITVGDLLDLESSITTVTGSGALTSNSVNITATIPMGDYTTTAHSLNLFTLKDDDRVWFLPKINISISPTTVAIHNGSEDFSTLNLTLEENEALEITFQSSTSSANEDATTPSYPLIIISGAKHSSFTLPILFTTTAETKETSQVSGTSFQATSTKDFSIITGNPANRLLNLMIPENITSQSSPVNITRSNITINNDAIVENDETITFEIDKDTAGNSILKESINYNITTKTKKTTSLKLQCVHTITNDDKLSLEYTGTSPVSEDSNSSYVITIVNTPTNTLATGIVGTAIKITGASLVISPSATDPAIITPSDVNRDIEITKPSISQPTISGNTYTLPITIPAYTVATAFNSYYITPKSDTTPEENEGINLVLDIPTSSSQLDTIASTINYRIENDDILSVNFDNTTPTSLSEEEDASYNYDNQYPNIVVSGVAPTEITLNVTMSKTTGSITLASNSDGDFVARTGANPTVIVVTIPKGNYTLKKFPLIDSGFPRIRDDNVAEPSEPFKLTLSKPTLKPSYINITNSTLNLEIKQNSPIVFSFVDYDTDIRIIEELISSSPERGVQIKVLGDVKVALKLEIGFKFTPNTSTSNKQFAEVNDIKFANVNGTTVTDIPNFYANIPVGNYVDSSPPIDITLPFYPIQDSRIELTEKFHIILKGIQGLGDFDSTTGKISSRNIYNHTQPTTSVPTPPNDSKKGASIEDRNKIKIDYVNKNPSVGYTVQEGNFVYFEVSGGIIDTDLYLSYEISPIDDELVFGIRKTISGNSTSVDINLLGDNINMPFDLSNLNPESSSDAKTNRVLIPKGDYSTIKRVKFNFSLPNDSIIEKTKRDFKIIFGKLYTSTSLSVFLKSDYTEEIQTYNSGSSLGIISLESDDILQISWSKNIFTSLEGTSDDDPKLRISGAILNNNTTTISIVLTQSGTNPANSGTDHNLNNTTTITLAANDYSLVANQLVSVFKTPFIIDDKLAEETEEFSFTFSLPPDSPLNYSGSDADRTAKFLIKNDDYVFIEFESNSSESAENITNINDKLPRLKITGAITEKEYTIPIKLKLISPNLNFANSANSGTEIDVVSEINISQNDPREGVINFIIPVRTSNAADNSKRNTIDTYLGKSFKFINDNFIEEDEEMEFSIDLNSILITNNKFLLVNPDGTKITLANNPSALKLSSSFTIKNDDQLTVQFKNEGYTGLEDSINTSDLPTLVVNGAFTTETYTLKVEISVEDTNTTGRKDAGAMGGTVLIRAKQDYTTTTNNTNKNLLEVTIPIINENNKEIPLTDLSILSDKIVEGDEIVKLKILEYSGRDIINYDNNGNKKISVGENPDKLTLESNLIILNDDILLVQFNETAYEANEDSNTIPILSITGAETYESYNIQIKIEFDNSELTPTKGTDFNLDTPTISGENDINFSIPINNYTNSANQNVRLTGFEILSDNVVEKNEELTLIITANNNKINQTILNKALSKITKDNTINVNISAKYTIVNDDFLIVQFKKDSYSGRENENENIPEITISNAIVTDNSPDLRIKFVFTGKNGIVNFNSSEDSPLADFSIDTNFTYSGTTMTYPIPNKDYTISTNQSISFNSFFSVESDTLLEEDEELHIDIRSEIPYINSYLSTGGVRLNAIYNPTDTRVNPQNWHLNASYMILNDDNITIQFSSATTKGKENSDEYTFPLIDVTGATTNKTYNFTIDISADDPTTTGLKPYNPPNNEPKDVYDYSFDNSTDDTNKIIFTLPIRKSTDKVRYKLNERDAETIVINKYINIEADNFLEKDEVLTFSINTDGLESINSTKTGLTLENKHTIINDDTLNIEFESKTLSIKEGNPTSTSTSNTTIAEFTILTDGARIYSNNDIELKIDISSDDINVNPKNPDTGLLNLDLLDYSVNTSTPNSNTISVTLTSSNIISEIRNEIRVFSLLINKDNRMEDDEVLNLKMTIPNDIFKNGVKLGSTEGIKEANATYTIENDDILEISFVDSIKTSNINIDLGTVRYVENKTEEINLPRISIKGATVEGYNGEVSFILNSLDKTTAIVNGNKKITASNYKLQIKVASDATAMATVNPFDNLVNIVLNPNEPDKLYAEFKILEGTTEQTTGVTYAVSPDITTVTGVTITNVANSGIYAIQITPSSYTPTSDVIYSLSTTINGTTLTKTFKIKGNTNYKIQAKIGTDVTPISEESAVVLDPFDSNKLVAQFETLAGNTMLTTGVTYNVSPSLSSISGITEEDANGIYKVRLSSTYSNEFEKIFTLSVTINGSSAITKIRTFKIKGKTDTTPLPLTVTIPKSSYKDISLDAKIFQINDFLPIGNKFKIIDDKELEDDETIYFRIEKGKKTKIDTTLGNEYKSEGILIILDDEPSLENSLVSVNKEIVFADGIDTVKITIKLLNNQGNTLSIQSGASIPITIETEQIGEQNEALKPKAESALMANPTDNTYTVSYSSTKPVVIKFNVLHGDETNKSKLAKSATVRFVGPNSGQYTALKTADNTPMLSGTAPYGAGNTLNLKIHDIGVPEAKTGYTFTGIKIQENGQWVLEDNVIKIPLDDGIYEISVEVEDRAGNKSRVTRFNDKALEISTVAPDKFTFSRVTTFIQSPRLFGTANPGTKVQLEIDGVVYPKSNEKIIVSEDGSWSIPRDNIDPLERGKSYDVKATVFTSTESQFKVYEGIYDGVDGVYEGGNLYGALVITDFPITSNEGFSPNNDGINDSWVIIDIEEHPKNTVNIYNRWGIIVWQTNDYNNDNNFWSGETKGNFLANSNRLPSGVYYYTINIPEESKPITGFVTILN